MESELVGVFNVYLRLLACDVVTACGCRHENRAGCGIMPLLCWRILSTENECLQLAEPLSRVAV